MTDVGTMYCVVIGGVADGMLLRKVRADAESIELRRPDHVKPLERADQAMPETVHTSDVYAVHSIELAGEMGHVFGVAVIQDQTLSWAITQLLVGYVENATRKLHEMQAHVYADKPH